MLIRLLPEQIAKMWDRIRPCVQEAVPVIGANDEEALVNVLNSLLLEESQCWINVEEASQKIDGLVVTTELWDGPTRTKNLLIYALWASGIFAQEVWTGGLQTLINFAHGIGCKSLIGYTESESVKKVVERFGGGVEYCVSFPVATMVKKSPQ
jgi:hypothetical protein